MIDYRTILRSDLERRKERNKRYSLRAFALRLNIPASLLSRVLSGKQALSPSAGIEIARCLLPDRDRRRLFLKSILRERRHSESENLGKLLEIPQLQKSRDAFAVEHHPSVSTLLCSAILELTSTSDFRWDMAWIASRLGATQDEVFESVRNLTASGLLVASGGTLSKCDVHTSLLPGDKSHEAARKQQEEILVHSREAIRAVNSGLRQHVALTFAVDPSQLPRIRGLILDALEEISDQVDRTAPTEVYQLAVQLFPLTKSE